MPPSACPLWPTDSPGQTAGERNRATGSYTTARTRSRNTSLPAVRPQSGGREATNAVATRFALVAISFARHDAGRHLSPVGQGELFYRLPYCKQ
jgi:hypothetical protein